MTARALRTCRPRCCLSCGDPLEDHAAPLQPGTYVGCYRCGRMYVAGGHSEHRLTPVFLRLEAAELQLVFDELLQAWWAAEARRTVSAAPAAA